MKRSLPFIASFLGFVGGFVDAAGYLGLGGLFTSHVTGNLAVLGARLARQQLHAGGGVVGVLFIPVFAAAVAGRAVIARLRKYYAALAGFVVGAAAGASLEHFGGLGTLLVPAMLLLALSAMHLGRALAQPA